MATNKKISELTELVEADLADDDVLAIVDVSAGETFKVRKSTLASALAGVATLAATTPVAVNQSTGSVTVSLNTVPITSGGTGATNASAALSALGGFADPLTTRGDIIIRGPSATQRLAIGAANQVLISDGTDPAYGQVPLASAVSGTLPVANGGTNATTAGDARTNLGLGSIATQDSSSVSITGGSVTGITDIAVADGGTGSSTASGARTNLGLVIGTDVQAFDADTMKSDTTKRITANMGFTPVTDASSSGSVTFDFSTGNISKITLSEDITSVTISGATAGDILHIQITQDSTARTISGWPAAVKWSGGGTAPTISTTSGAVDIVSALYDGTNYWASITQDHQ